MTIEQQIQVFEERLIKAIEKRDRFLRQSLRKRDDPFEAKNRKVQAVKFADQIRGLRSRIEHLQRPS